MYKRCIVFMMILLSVLMCGCHSDPSTNGDFIFDLPDGFTISDVTDQHCVIENSSGTTVGGFVLTDLQAKDLRESNSSALGRYLNTLAWGCEFLSWHAGDYWHPIQLVSLSVTDPDTQERVEYERVLFVRDSSVYDMWFNKALIDEDMISAFYSIAEAK